MMHKDRKGKSKTIHTYVHYHLDVQLGFWFSISDGVVNDWTISGVFWWEKVNQRRRRCRVRNMYEKAIKGRQKAQGYTTWTSNKFIMQKLYRMFPSRRLSSYLAFFRTQA